jgi:hypothetical protein
LELIRSAALFTITGQIKPGTGLLIYRGKVITGHIIFSSSGILRNLQFTITYRGIICLQEKEYRSWQFLIFENGKKQNNLGEP